MKVKEMMAVWRYDEFPGFLCGRITGMDKFGNVETVEFGAKKFFKPILLLPISEYAHIKEQLELLRKIYIDKQEEIAVELDALCADGLPKNLVDALRKGK
ncbi:MAG: hypothetical protein DRH26_00550 [Deltaproteobacteria bacterium]|nr:MAG: hypothetical protein DRH26_00550 [Deltaproteobacteria bacterium]